MQRHFLGSTLWNAVLSTSGRCLGFSFCLSLVLACNGPLPFMSGGALQGAERPVPATWDLEEAFGVAQLETQPDAPYSVNIAYTQIDGRVYINAGDSETNWAKHIAVDPKIRLRVKDVIYAGQAIRITEAAEIAEFGRAWTAESSFHRDPAALDDVWLYQMVPR